MKIILDCFGGDNSPQAHVLGAIQAIKENEDLTVVLVGDAEKIAVELEKYDFNESQIEVLNATDVIGCDEKPTLAIREKVNSSLVVALDLLKHDEECGALVSSGSTGAILAGAIMKIGRIKGISRPALTPLLPTLTDGRMMLVDCGANADCKPVNLLHFGLMGAVYFRQVMGVKTPRIALLSNGTEDEKGNELTKAVFPLLKELKDVQFVGNCEARDILSGKFDIVVCDGFSGNIALKASEGAINLCLKTIKTEVKKSFIAKLGALLMKKQFGVIKKKMNYNSFGGAVVLGADRNIIKAHGSSNEIAIKASILQAMAVAKGDLIGKIKAGLTEIESINVD